MFDVLDRFVLSVLMTELKIFLWCRELIMIMTEIRVLGVAWVLDTCTVSQGCTGCRISIYTCNDRVIKSNEEAHVLRSPCVGDRAATRNERIDLEHVCVAHLLTNCQHIGSG